MTDLVDAITEFEKVLVRIRREFHRIPEVAFKEYQTSERIAAYLREWGLEVETGVGKTGVVALLKGAKDGKTIGIRADIDALPIKEETGFDYASKNEGQMHACGHDAHIAIGLGTAKVLSKFKDRIAGNVKFLFQPSEEALTGAEAMIADGALNNPAVEAIIGLHVWPDMDSGRIGVKEGKLMAAVDSFEIEIRGKGGHAAIPDKSVDPIVMASEVVTALQRIVSREISPLKPAVISVGTFKAGTAFNIIPDKVELSGTVRTFDPEVRKFIPGRMEEIIAGITEGSRGSYNFNFDFGIPPVNNEPGLVARVKKVISDTMGRDRNVEDVEPSMGGEDFAFYQQKIPGVFLFLGTRNEKKGLTHSLHHPQFSIDEDILGLGVRVMSEVVFDYLKE